MRFEYGIIHWVEQDFNGLETLNSSTLNFQVWFFNWFRLNLSSFRRRGLWVLVCQHVLSIWDGGVRGLMSAIWPPIYPPWRSDCSHWSLKDKIVLLLIPLTLTWKSTFWLQMIFDSFNWFHLIQNFANKAPVVLSAMCWGFAFCLTWTIGIGFQALPQQRLITWLQVRQMSFGFMVFHGASWYNWSYSHAIVPFIWIHFSILATWATCKVLKVPRIM